MRFSGVGCSLKILFVFVKTLRRHYAFYDNVGKIQEMLLES